MKVADRALDVPVGESAAIESVDVTVYRVPTDAPYESDGTLEWDATTVVLVEIRAAGVTGWGWTYAGSACGHVVGSTLRRVLTGSDALATGARWDDMARALRNEGLPGAGAMAVSACDIALWDLRGKVLGRSVAAWQPPPVGGKALVQRHCHHQAVLGFDADRELLTAAGVDAEVLDSGCCGLAGNFGFEDGHHEISLAIGERVLLPAVRRAPDTTTILADGFSCRTQIAEATDRSAHHFAELLAARLPPVQLGRQVLALNDTRSVVIIDRPG